jgi:hypothetical protein
VERRVRNEILAKKGGGVDVTLVSVSHGGDEYKGGRRSLGK